MHGFRQDLCKMNDAVFIQEHWWAPYNLRDVQDTCPDMLCPMSSANVISNGVLKGRPFGGCRSFCCILSCGQYWSLCCFRQWD